MSHYSTIIKNIRIYVGFDKHSLEDLLQNTDGTFYKIHIFIISYNSLEIINILSLINDYAAKNINTTLILHSNRVNLLKSSLQKYLKNNNIKIDTSDFIRFNLNHDRYITITYTNSRILIREIEIVLNYIYVLFEKKIKILD